ncbi:hypothetical protein GIS00_07330 [Nakamurella sp. YIM 132087]|uniref:Oligosaccharide flippase family protein n=1 Tax=Nakamurella alba TaxID=2665158 RepID=A0A7K1FLJ5_9ACTN|nr:hypothetical protein [Nakamurella alba]MTD13754.1 hypothetical protein [Nakamurella alba]
MVLDVEAPPRRPVRRQSGFARIAGISASLVGTQALTSVLGLVFWTLAARSFTVHDVGVAGAAVSMMLLLSSLGTLGLGTLLIARLPATAPERKRLLVRTSLLAAGGAGGLLGLVVPLFAVYVIGADNLRPLASSPQGLLGFALGTAAMSVVLVLDQAVLTIGVGALQLERNVAASIIKILALLLFGAMGLSSGMVIFLAWTVGTLVSLPLVAWRTRRKGPRPEGEKTFDRAVLKGLGRAAASHHALNTTLQAALQILPILVTVLLSAQENAFFNSAILVSGFVFALPYAVAISLFASAGGNESEVLARMRVTIPFSLGISAAAYLALFPIAGFVLSIFGSSYASEGVDILRLVTMAGLPFVIKDHYIALRRVQDRTTEAVLMMTGFLVLELAAATVGAIYGGALGLCVGWVAVLYVEAVVFGVGLARSARKAGPPAERIEVPEQDRPEPRPMQMASALVLSGESGPSLVPSGALVDQSVEHSPEPAPAPARVPRRPDSPLPRSEERRLARIAARRNLFGPLLAVMGLGVLVLSLAANGSRESGPNGFYQALWIVGLVLIVLPAAIRVLAATTSAAERIRLAIAVPVMLELTRLVLYPTYFATHDEQIHTDTLRQIDETSRLFSLNPLLPTSAFYPGLEVITDGIHRFTGLSPFVSSWIVLILSRVIIALAIVGLIQLITRSSRAAAIGALIYICNPQQLFFNSQYSYQTLALPLAVFAAYAFLSRRRGSAYSLVLPLLATAAVTFTHHLTAMLLVGAFAVWWLIEVVLGRRSIERAEQREHPDSDERRRGLRVGHRVIQRRQDVIGLLVLWVSGAVMSVAAALNPGSPVLGYLYDIFNGFQQGFTGLAKGDETKPLFADSAGSGPAPWEQVLLVSSVLLIGVCMLIALVQAWLQFTVRRTPAFVLTLLALLYPIIPAGHLSVSTAEVGDRASGFVFVGLAMVMGVWFVLQRRRAWFGRTAAAVLTVVFLGSVVLGSGPTSRQLPGPYLISADARSIDSDNLAAAEWLAAEIPPETRVYADRVSGLLAASVGGQFTVRHLSTKVDASRLLLDPNLTAADYELIKKAGLSYLIVDTRLAQGLPHLDVYIETGEFEGRTRTGPVPAAALQKFSTVPGVSRIYDNGSLQIYDLRGLRDAG